MEIARRVLKIREPGGDRDVLVRIFAPVYEERRGWGCRYEIDWPDRLRSGRSGGFDTVQALEIALTLVGAELYASSYHEAGTLMFQQAGSGYGFPVPSTMRDMLIGDDAKYL